LFIAVTINFAIITVKNAEAEKYGGVEFPDGEISFADVVISYKPGPGVLYPYNVPSTSLGIPDCHVGGDKAVSLGYGGELILQFTNNSLTTSGDNSNDLWIFEVGNLTEPTEISISENGRDWIAVGKTSGATSGIDLDAYIGSGVSLGKKYSFIKIVDLLPYTGDSPYRGADIDAVGAISSDDAVPLIANAGSDQIVYNGISLDGSNSYPANQIISYQWQIQHRENAEYSVTAEGVNPTLSNLKKGFYDVTLIISNNKLETSSDKMIFSATGTPICEVNGDGKTGLEEAIHILQVVSGLRP